MVRYGLVLAGVALCAPARAAEAAAAGDGALASGHDTATLFRVLLRDCPALSEAEITRMLAAELAADSEPPQAVREPTWVVVRCVGSEVLLEVHDPRSGQAIQRRFDFGNSGPKARARLIAIAAAELVSAGWAEFSRAEASPRSAATSVSPPPRRKAASERETTSPAPAEPRLPRRSNSTLLLGTDPNVAREGVGPHGERLIYGDYVWERLPARTVFRLVALGSARRFVERGGGFFGGGLRFGSDLVPLHAWAIDVFAEAGTLHRGREGPLHIESWSVGGSLGWLFELGSRITLRTGGGLRTGLVRTRERNGAAQFGLPAFWGWPFATASSTLTLGRTLLELSSEAGYAAIPIGLGAGGASVRGAWLSLQVGVGLRL